VADLRLGIQDNREFPVASRVEFTRKHMPPPLSVVIATTQAWPEIRGCLDSLYAQAGELRAEIIVADGNGRGLPDTESRYPQVRWLKALGATVFQLRALGMAAAKGDIVAVTEDHCRVTPGWCRQILQAHREWPAAAVIGGAVENGATEHLSDWANFLIANGAFLLPLPTGEREEVTGQANISYKRRVLPAAYPAIGMVEAHYKQLLRERGEKLVNDDRIVVEHVQSLGFLGSCLIHYHDGRCTAGFHRPRVSRRTWLFQLARGLALPVRVLIDTLRITLRIALRKPRHRIPALASAPLIAGLLCFHAAGEFVGYLTGPGSSPSQLR
jgi:hypothetical protein